MIDNTSETLELEAVVESAVSPIITITSAGEILTANQATIKMFGYSKHELIGQNVKMLAPEPYRSAHDGYLEAFRRTGEKKIIGTGRELEAERKDGSRFPIHLSISEFSKDGQQFFVGILNDLTKVKESEQKTRAIINAAVSPVITITERGMIESVNEATTKMFGYQVDELIGQNVKMLADTPHRENHDGYLDNYLRSGNKKIIGTGRELEAKRKDGSLFPIHLSVSEFMVGGLRYFVGIISDLSEVKKAQEGLKQAHYQLESQTKMQRAQIEIYQLLGADNELKDKADSVIDFICRQLKAPVGILYIVSEDQEYAEYLSGHCVPVKLAKKRFARGEGIVGQVLKTAQYCYEEVYSPSNIILESGLASVSLNHLSGFPIINAGKVIAILETGSEFPPAQEGIELLGLVGEAISLNFLIKIKDQRLKELLSETRLQAGNLQSQQEELKATNEELQASEEKLKSQQEELRSANEELRYRAKALEVEKSRLGEKTEELEQAQSLLKGHAKQVEEASRYKSEFLANMSHELRTPLNSILMLSQSMAENRKGNLIERQVSNLETINSAGTDLLTLINDILDLSKVEAGKLEVVSESFRVDRFLENVANIIEPLASSKNLKFEVECLDGVPFALENDRGRLEQILRNLLSNAVKFTEEGKVKVTVSPYDNEHISFAISDTGIGIPEDQTSRVFQAFQQIDGKTTRKFGGTGLGLSITKELVKLLGGEIHLESSIGKGSIFTVILPISYKERSEPSPALLAAKPRIDKPAVKGKMTASLRDDRYNIQLGDKVILIIEDEESFAEILVNHCHDLGFKAVTSADGVRGVRLAEELRPSGILLDLSLPRINGLEVIDLLKLSSITQHIPIQVISGQELMWESLAKGAIGYLDKPVDSKSLSNALKKIDGLAPRKNRTLLIVEDDQDQCRAIEELLGDHDLDIIFATTGQEGLSLIEERSPHCVILDMKLPDMDGLAFLKRAQQEFSTTLPPVIVYTGKELSDQEVIGLEKYSKSIIIKGAKSPDRLVSETTLFLHRIEKNLSRAQKKVLQNLRDPGRVLRGRKILIVDDDARNRMSLSEVLEDTGVSITTANNGQEALDLFQEQKESYDLVLMDMMMPVMDGYDATAAVKVQNNEIPVIALTAKAMMGEREKCLAAGCDDYISKPVNTDQLLSLLRVWLYRSG